MQVNVVDESKTLGGNTTIITQALNVFAQQVTTAWGLPKMNVVQGSARVTNAWNVVFVNQFPNPAVGSNVLGYHEVINTLPIAYVRVDAFGKRSPLGTYVKPLTILRKQIHAAICTPGVASVAMHELAEMIVDPNCNRYATDSQGRNWLMEVCDHTVGQYNIPLPTYSANVIAPDFTHPSFYDLKGEAPYSQMNVPSKPFTLVKGAYGYYKSPNGDLPIAADQLDVE
jgi:hypothetical protein